jgi:hypothetical protein
MIISGDVFVNGQNIKEMNGQINQIETTSRVEEVCIATGESGHYSNYDYTKLNSTNKYTPSVLLSDLATGWLASATNVCI